MPFYKPEGVTEFLGEGTGSYIGVVDETTVLKFPKVQGTEYDLAILAVEAEIFKAIGPHKHIIGFKGRTDDGLLLERALCSVAKYLRHNQPTLQQRVAWARQTTEAVALTHNKRVIHCDISVGNILLDHDLTAKLCDFQGLLFGADGTLKKDGCTREGAKASMPRDNELYADRKTDIFALGSAFYYMMQGHQPFPDLSSSRDSERIKARFQAHQFPEVQPPLMNRVIHKCWAGQYKSAEAVLQELGSDDVDLMAGS